MPSSKVTACPESLSPSKSYSKFDGVNRRQLTTDYSTPICPAGRGVSKRRPASEVWGFFPQAQVFSSAGSAGIAGINLQSASALCHVCTRITSASVARRSGPRFFIISLTVTKKKRSEGKARRRRDTPLEYLTGSAMAGQAADFLENGRVRYLLVITGVSSPILNIIPHPK
jgi:hypothetical protein